MKEVPILIVADGLPDILQHRAKQYAEYKENLHKLCESTWHNVRVMEMPEHVHQSQALRRALETIDTDFSFYTGHGWVLHGEIPWGKLLEVGANSIRFYIFDEIHPDHQHLFQEREMVAGVPLMKTIQFADGPALYKTSWLKETIQKYVRPEAKCFNEDILWGIFANKGWAGWERMYAYAPAKMNRNVWFNEREDDPTPARNV